MQIKIQEIRDVKIRGVEVVFAEDVPISEAVDHFECTTWPLLTAFQSQEIVCGKMEGWHHVPVYNKVEYHHDAEIFYMVSGTALMYFVDLDENDNVLMDTAQMVRIPAGTLFNVEAHKGHWVPVAEGDTYFAMVVAPKQGDIHLPLPEAIEGVC